MVAGEPALGAVIKDAKEQLRALPDGLTYGLLRYLNTDVDLAGPDPSIGFNYLGRLGAAGAEASDDLWRVSQDGLSVAAATRRADATEAHRGTQRRHRRHRGRPAPARQLDVGALGTGRRPDQPTQPTVVRRSDRHLRARPPRRRRADPLRITPARLSQHQIDELNQHYRIADILPLTPLQQGLLFHASTARQRDDLYAMQLDIALAGPLDPHRLREAVHAVLTRHPNLAARFCEQLDEPVQMILADPVVPWRYIELDRRPDVESRSSGCARPNAPRSAIWPTSRPYVRR